MIVTSKWQVKMLLSQECVKLKELAPLMTEKSGKRYTMDGLSHKLNRGRLTYDEMLLITEILGYKIKFEKIPYEFND